MTCLAAIAVAQRAHLKHFQDMTEYGVYYDSDLQNVIAEIAIETFIHPPTPRPTNHTKHCTHTHVLQKCLHHWQVQYCATEVLASSAIFAVYVNLWPAGWCHTASVQSGTGLRPAEPQPPWRPGPQQSPPMLPKVKSQLCGGTLQPKTSLQNQIDQKSWCQGGQVFAWSAVNTYIWVTLGQPLVLDA